MHSSVAYLSLGLAALFFNFSLTSGSVISCPPNMVQQELNPKINQLCSAIEQILQDPPTVNELYPARLIDDRNTNSNAKRQDVDHVFLRFGRKFGL